MVFSKKGYPANTGVTVPRDPASPSEQNSPLYKEESESGVVTHACCPSIPQGGWYRRTMTSSSAWATEHDAVSKQDRRKNKNKSFAPRHHQHCHLALNMPHASERRHRRKQSSGHKTGNQHTPRFTRTNFIEKQARARIAVGIGIQVRIGCCNFLKMNLTTFKIISYAQ